MADKAAESGRCITITLKYDSGVIHSKRRSEGIFVFVFRFNSYLEKCITVSNPYILRSIWFPYKHLLLSFHVGTSSQTPRSVCITFVCHCTHRLTCSLMPVHFSPCQHNYDSFSIFNNVANACMTHSMTHTL